MKSIIDADKKLSSAIDNHFTNELKLLGIPAEERLRDFSQIKNNLIRGLSRQEKIDLVSFFDDPKNAQKIGEYKKYFSTKSPAIQNALQKFYSEKATTLATITKDETNKANTIVDS